MTSPISKKTNSETPVRNRFYFESTVENGSHFETPAKIDPRLIPKSFSKYSFTTIKDNIPPIKLRSSKSSNNASKKQSDLSFTQPPFEADIEYRSGENKPKQMNKNPDPNGSQGNSSQDDRITGVYHNEFPLEFKKLSLKNPRDLKRDENLQLPKLKTSEEPRIGLDRFRQKGTTTNTPPSSDDGEDSDGEDNSLYSPVQQNADLGNLTNRAFLTDLINVAKKYPTPSTNTISFMHSMSKKTTRAAIEEIRNSGK